MSISAGEAAARVSWRVQPLRTRVGPVSGKEDPSATNAVVVRSSPQLAALFPSCLRHGRYAGFSALTDGLRAAPNVCSLHIPTVRGDVLIPGAMS